MLEVTQQVGDRMDPSSYVASPGHPAPLGLASSSLDGLGKDQWW